MIQLNCNFIRCHKQEGVKGVFYFVHLSSEDYGIFVIFSSKEIKAKYLSPVVAKFDLYVFNNKLNLKFLGID